MDLETLRLGGGAQCIWLCAFLLGRAEDGRDVVAAVQESFEHSLAEILLPDDRYLHFEKAPAFFLASISASLMPSTSFRISSVCSPSVGERSIFAGEAESLIGIPTL